MRCFGRLCCVALTVGVPLACAGASAPSRCDALDKLTLAGVGRVHGLSAADDLGAQLQALVEGRTCSEPQAQLALKAHLHLLSWRLAQAGAHSELLAMARALDQGPFAAQAAALRTTLSATATATGQRWERHALPPAEAPPSALVAAQRHALHATLGTAGNAPEHTAAWVAFTSQHRSCVAVVGGRQGPSGLLQFRIISDGRPLPLHGDPPVVRWPAEHADPVTLCVAQPLTGTERLTAGPPGGAEIMQWPLPVGTVARARGSLLASPQERPLLRAPCQKAQADAAARWACVRAGVLP